MKVNYAENATDYTIALTNANQEYALTLPDEVVAIEIQAREAVDLRMSFVAGKVAASTEPFRTIKSGTVYSKELLYINATTLYLACGTAAKNAEVRVWL